MTKKISALFFTLVMTVSTLIIIAPSDLKVDAAHEEIYEGTQYGNASLDLDYNFIDTVTDRLSEIGRDKEKGRAFGTDGEQDAADEIYTWMSGSNYCNLGSENVKSESIINQWYPWKRVAYNNQPLAGKLSVTFDTMKLKVKTPTENITLDNDDWDFFIHPSFKDIFYKAYYNYGLSDTYDHTDLAVIETVGNVHVDDDELTKFFEEEAGDLEIKIRVLLDNEDSTLSINDVIKQQFEEYFNWDLEPLDDTPPAFYKPVDCSSDYVFIAEDYFFNPNPSVPDWYNRIPKVLKVNIEKHVMSFLRLVHKKYDEKFKGIIYYDFHDDTFDMNYLFNTPVPVIFINGSLGEKITADISNTTVDFYLDQTWEDQVYSKNIIGEIPGKDNSKTVIVSCLYDSWWCQGTGDAAIGMGMVLALAKYMKKLYDDYNIQPKYTVKFIAFCGEEYLVRGGKYYNKIHRTEDIAAMIDLNQLGFKQPPGYLNSDLVLQLWSNKDRTRQKLSKITSAVNWAERTNNKYSGPSYHLGNFTGGPTGNKDPFVMSRIVPGFIRHRRDMESVYLLKDFEWRMHHRSGSDGTKHHTKGDTTQWKDNDDIDVTAEMAWNITKYYTINPDCWLDDKDNITIEKFDTPDDQNTWNDSVNITFSIKTIMPHDRVFVKATLIPKKIFLGLLYSYSTTKNYIIGTNGINDTLTITLDESAPKGDYDLYLHVYNSTGETDGYLCDYPVRLGWFANDTYHATLYMGPENDYPDPVDDINIDGPIEAVRDIELAVTTTDPQGDSISYQFCFAEAEKTNKTYDSWTRLVPSGHTCKKIHVWNTTDEKWVKVRARDESLNMHNCLLQWSNWMSFTVTGGCRLGPEKPRNPNGIVGIPVTLNISQMGCSDGNIDWGDGSDLESVYPFTGGESTTMTHTYTSIGEFTANLTYSKEVGSGTAYDTLLVHIDYVTADFNASTYYAQPFETITFTEDADVHENYTITSYNWSFGDGNYSTEQNPSYNYSNDGTYNVTLRVEDNASHNHSLTRIIRVDSEEPTIIDVHLPEDALKYQYGDDFHMEVNTFDTHSGVSETAGDVTLTITYPNGTIDQFNMSNNQSTEWDYEYVFENAPLIGEYQVNFSVKDKSNNTIGATGFTFDVEPIIGYPQTALDIVNTTDRISGSVFTCYERAEADNITVHINRSGPVGGQGVDHGKSKCLVYQADNGSLIGTTEEKNPNTNGNKTWVTYNFSSPKPVLEGNKDYIVGFWSNTSCNLSYGGSGDEMKGRYANITYGTPPDPVTWDGNETRLYTIYLSYTAIPNITNISHTPAIAGYGFGVNITANATNEISGIKTVQVNVTSPDNTTECFAMNKVWNETKKYYYNFTDTWQTGRYNYTIWTYDLIGNGLNSSQYSFNVSANATITIATLKESYGSNETINLTDPPCGKTPPVGYKLLGNNSVLHMWNKYDDYYFNASNGVQFTNHYNEYWSHNVLMLGYYDNDQWNVIYRTDELSGFHKNIKSDYETYVNATLWKDLMYKGYDFRLAIRYHLGLDDKNLTIIPYIKAYDDIPYVLGFAWEIKDIQIGMTPEYDFIMINDTSYYLNQTLGEIYTSLDDPIFIIQENITKSHNESLYLKWNGSLTYQVWVESRDGQYNAPVTLAIRIGTMNIGQEKHTRLYWHDKEKASVTYYFDGYDTGEAWETNPSYMVDGSLSNFARSTISLDCELCNSNNCSQGTNLGTITKVELRVYGNHSGSSGYIKLIPVINGQNGQGDYTFSTSSSPAWSQWFDITNDGAAPETWTWQNITEMDCRVLIPYIGSYDMWCAKVEIRVTYKPNANPSISNPVPADETVGVSLTPVLNITVSDSDGDLMNITWLSNSSGSWQVFGANNSIGNGTYHQVFANASVNGKWWYWKVNVTDGKNYTVSPVYKFYTGYPSKIKNTGSYDIRGYLLLRIEWYNESSQEWEFNHDANRILVRINSSEEFGIDTFFNGMVNTSEFIYGNGTYRVYAELTDPYDNILKSNDDDAKYAVLKDWYEFTVTYT
jgi:hypothetical protein